jgi:phosphohistidine phosphatase
MELLVIRHAIAMEREEWARTGRPDDDRPLTDAGRRRMRKNARGIHRFAPHPDVIATSPYLRAVDTARVVAETLGIARMETVEALVPDRHPRELARWLNDSANAPTVAVVGHEPHLGSLVTWLCSGRDAPAVEFKKGGACLLRLEGKADAAAAVMQWLLTASQLRAVAD